MTSNPFSLSGKKGLILGIANDHSIAWGCARLLRELGADVLATCLNDKARKYVEPLTAPLGIELINCDVEAPGQLEAAVEHAVRKFGQLDFVIHSIAWAPLQDLHGKVVDSSREGFARAMSVSCHSFAELAKLSAPHMQAGGSMLSMTYLGSGEAVPHYGLMGPVKAALESMVRYMAMELGPRNIRVHAVSPGPILTRAASGIAEFDSLMATAKAKAPLQRLVTLEEIAQLSAFLCSDAASGMTGQVVYVDAGVHAVD
ncbi:enoyl-ACP reductase FabI [Xylophilus sp. ASV27]|uniref:enoyl-ACP reductase FabI n=1 Tax=Xylophilus sp. ASV27 TaxID=2795129 RepID=UPI0018EB5C9C|nr:enoyl-ACP reductase FabI [Xylophilus sp. ASV27]